MTQTDKRMKLTNEPLSGMKVGWWLVQGFHHITQEDKRVKLINKVFSRMKVDWCLLKGPMTDTRMKLIDALRK